ncbi:unnamed protein product [Vitrella brassicaformis CCMP3155]|uniref:Uncharacterized protein n=1 Tax=Vitrella brassicaformis (strain CCMP3155) TaxID=1169540 RepID=A0A0G4EQ56_VITBC|nr:unnamed protein product [Vitrella brassicaformis CCMP3155]|eukprot:CEL99564.1 unnamed protein product [Vitrella brassicaformis CCMP3155]
MEPPKPKSSTRTTDKSVEAKACPNNRHPAAVSFTFFKGRSKFQKCFWCGECGHGYLDWLDFHAKLAAAKPNKTFPTLPGIKDDTNYTAPRDKGLWNRMSKKVLEPFFEEAVRGSYKDYQDHQQALRRRRLGR